MDLLLLLDAGMLDPSFFLRESAHLELENSAALGAIGVSKGWDAGALLFLGAVGWAILMGVCL